jgi:ABC-type antimicrobial peptide transport system permease subunit
MALLLGVVGVAAGIGAAIGLSQLMAAMLFEISPVDPATYAVVAGLLLAAVSWATYLPASKAVAVDPVVALRAD